VSPQFQTFEPTSNPPQHNRIHTLVNRLIEIGEGIGLVEEWAEYHTLTLPEWRELQVVAEETPATYKIRLDYDPDRQELAIRMPTSSFHNIVAKDTTELLLQRLRDYVGDAQTREFSNWHEVHLKFPNSGERSADFGIFDNISRYPKLVVEVGYSNKPLRHLAEEYMRSSNGHIRTIVVVDPRYCKDTKPQLHSIRIYRLKITGNTLECTLSAKHILRAYKNDGTYTDFDDTVQFYPSDFSNNTNDDSFGIPFKEFLDVIDRAEVYENAPEPPPIVPNPIWVSSTRSPDRARHPMTTRSRSRRRHPMTTRSQANGGTR
jgi:hypothetical protein